MMNWPDSMPFNANYKQKQNAKNFKMINSHRTEASHTKTQNMTHVYYCRQLNGYPKLS